MGLTINYKVSSTAKTEQVAAEQVAAMRKAAVGLPFDKVGRVKAQSVGQNDQPKDWVVIQSGKSVSCPWNKRISRSVYPERMVTFSIDVGDGCEELNIGLAKYPETVTWDYRVESDQRFQALAEGDWQYRFDYDKWSRFRHRTKSQLLLTDRQPREVKTGLTGWRWGSFCKTQYAAEAGIANFLRCHVAAVTFLELVGKLPGIKVKINDEGHYGPATYSDDHNEARAAGREPTYVDHPGTYSPSVLVAELGSAQEMIAAIAGALKDAVGADCKVVAPIFNNPNFEQLEFRGQNRANVVPFLKALRRIG